MGPFRVDSLKTFQGLIFIRKGSNLPNNYSPVCFADSEEVQQIYKDWKNI